MFIPFHSYEPSSPFYIESRIARNTIATHPSGSRCNICGVKWNTSQRRDAAMLRFSMSASLLCRPPFFIHVPPSTSTPMRYWGKQTSKQCLRPITLSNGYSDTGSNSAGASIAQYRSNKIALSFFARVLMRTRTISTSLSPADGGTGTRTQNRLKSQNSGRRSFKPQELY